MLEAGDDEGEDGEDDNKKDGKEEAGRMTQAASHRLEQEKQARLLSVLEVRPSTSATDSDLCP